MNCTKTISSLHYNKTRVTLAYVMILSEGRRKHFLVNISTIAVIVCAAVPPTSRTSLTTLTDHHQMPEGTQTDSYSH